jgi:sulfate permease, SulP family
LPFDACQASFPSAAASPRRDHCARWRFHDGPLFFANAANFHRLALAAVAAYDWPDAQVEWLVLDVEANMYMDITAAGSLAQLYDDLADSGVRLGLARVKNDLALQMDRAGLLDLVGPDMLFPTVGTAVAAFQSRPGAAGSEAG